MLNITNHKVNAKQNHNEIRYHFIPIIIEYLSSERQEIRDAGKDVARRELSCSAGGFLR